MQSVIDQSAGLVGEQQAMTLTRTLNEATRDSVAKTASRQVQAEKDRVLSELVEANRSAAMNPGSEALLDFSEKTFVVTDEAGNAIGEVTLPPAEQKAAQVADAERVFAIGRDLVMSDDPDERARGAEMLML